nr:unnamed protein product [Digitaria exilis]
MEAVVSSPSRRSRQGPCCSASIRRAPELPPRGLQCLPCTRQQSSAMASAIVGAVEKRCGAAAARSVAVSRTAEAIPARSTTTQLRDRRRGLRPPGPPNGRRGQRLGAEPLTPKESKGRHVWKVAQPGRGEGRDARRPVGATRTRRCACDGRRREDGAGSGEWANRRVLQNYSSESKPGIYPLTMPQLDHQLTRNAESPRQNAPVDNVTWNDILAMDHQLTRNAESPRQNAPIDNVTWNDILAMEPPP